MSEPRRKFSQVWLHDMMLTLAPWFEKRGVDFGKVRVTRISVADHSLSGKIRGRAWTGRTRDGHYNIFVTAHADDVIEIGHILVHEAIHIILGAGFGHGKEFREMALKLGLTGKMKSTAAGPELAEHLAHIAKELGPYPHKAIPEVPTLPRVPTAFGWRAVCEGCKSIVRFKGKTYERGVIVICDNEDCDHVGVQMEIEEDVPPPKRKRRKHKPYTSVGIHVAF